MLENDRYNRALNSVQPIQERNPYIDVGSLKEILLSENYATQSALDRLNVDRSTLPVNVPEVNRVVGVKRTTLFNKPLIIEIMGMPNAGKSFLSEQYASNNNCHFIPERYETAKERASITSDPDEMVDFFMQGFSIEALTYVGLIDENEILDVPIIIDKGYFGQLPYRRAKLLHGRTSADKDNSDRKVGLIHRVEILTDSGEYHYAIVNCLTTPKTSLKPERRTDEDLTEKPTILIPEFLNTLYEQHLRLHHEFIHFEKSSDRSLPLTYACVDLNSENFTKNRLLFNNIVHQITATHYRLRQDRLLLLL